jgi:hypothetical protein
MQPGFVRYRLVRSGSRRSTEVLMSWGIALWLAESGSAWLGLAWHWRCETSMIILRGCHRQFSRPRQAFGPREIFAEIAACGLRFPRAASGRERVRAEEPSAGGAARGGSRRCGGRGAAGPERYQAARRPGLRGSRVPSCQRRLNFHPSPTLRAGFQGAVGPDFSGAGGLVAIARGLSNT